MPASGLRSCGEPGQSRAGPCFKHHSVREEMTSVPHDLQPIRVLGISGSLRKASLNTAALRAAQELLPEGMRLEIFDLAPLQMYNPDVEAEGFPEPVREFRARLAAADALLF